MSETRRCGIWRWLVGIYGIANWGGNSFRPVQGDYTGCQAAAGHGPDAFYISQQQKSQLGQAHRTCQVGSDAHDRDESLRVVAGKRNDDDEMEGKQNKKKIEIKINKTGNIFHRGNRGDCLNNSIHFIHQTLRVCSKSESKTNYRYLSHPSQFVASSSSSSSLSNIVGKQYNER